MAIGTTAEYKIYRNITASANDTQIDFALAAVNAWVAKYCGITLTSSTLTEYYDGYGTDSLMLKTIPITSVTSVSLVNSDGSLTVLDSTTYRTDLDTGKLSRINSLSSLLYQANFGENPVSSVDIQPNFPQGFRNIKVIYVAGYTSGTGADADLKLAIYEEVDSIMASIGLRESNEEEFKVTIEEAIRLKRNRFEPFRRYSL